MNPTEPPDATEFLKQVEVEAARPDPSAQMHPRDQVMQAAGQELSILVSKLADDYKLTAIEYLYLLATLMRGHLQVACLRGRQ